MVSIPMTPKRVGEVASTAEPAPWWLTPILGVLSVLAGILVLARPGGGLVFVAVVSGIFLLVDSIFEFVSSLTRGAEERGLTAVLGLLGIIAGILLVRHPGNSLTVVALVLGIWLVGIGSVRIAQTLLFGLDWWTVALGGVQLVAGTIIVASPDIGVATLALLTGLSFLLNGAALVVLGWMLRNDELEGPHRATPAPAP